MTARTSANLPAKTFVDSNVLIYAHDKSAGWKQMVAQRVLDELWVQAGGTLSVQVLQEFYTVVTRRLKSPISRESARRIVDLYMVWCGETTANEVKAAFQIEDEARISFWDALIVACARKNGATRILSEDLSAGQTIGGIVIVNPFQEE